uniref:Uncharacterized protein n=1 Tax=Arundo donax TaxID=35708 RepID=A0A0A8ZFE3_ARUDO
MQVARLWVFCCAKARIFLVNCESGRVRESGLVGSVPVLHDCLVRFSSRELRP